MSGPDIRIRALKLRLRGGDAGAARSFAKRLGRAIAEQGPVAGSAWPKEIRVRLRTPTGEGSADLAQRIVRRLGEKAR